MLQIHCHNIADGIISCKHMCCRDGVDKAPKPPKGSFVSAASLLRPSTLSYKRDSSASLPPAMRTAESTTSRNGQNTDIETIDLAGGRDECAKDAPREFRKLDKLHKSVNNGRSAPLLVHKKPSFDYMKGELPEVTILNEKPNAVESSDKPLTDYGDDWMGGLPSPSALLGKLPVQGRSPSHEKSTSYGSSLPSIPTLLRRNEGATDIFAQTFPDCDSMGDFQPSYLNDEEADLEAAMVGLSDSVAMYEDSQAHAGTDETTLNGEEARADEEHPHESSFPFSPCRLTKHAKTSAASFAPKEEKLFLSTDSPAKSAEQSKKRAAAVAFEDEDVPSLAPATKERKISEQPGPAVQPSSNAGNQIAAPPPEIKPGQPAWVYDFDPAFIADFQDFVDFV